MVAKYLRINLFYKILRPFSAFTRNRRMSLYFNLMRIEEGTNIIDLGGQPMIWDSAPVRLNITILNLPGSANVHYQTKHNIGYIEGDACKVDGIEDRSFDTVFSNSFIEHVGPSNNMAAFAREVRRLGKSYWVQTPSKYFPIEAHCGMPFWWFYPHSVRSYFIRRWRKKLPAWTKMVEETTVLTKYDLREYFPEATIVVERFFGIPKSYVAYYRQDQI
ncbi:MAG: class I SAM-dependent methyltransferase [Blastochloris sp.]|nr:class I SAM-dependent methyltransferase [Blastochloris sp.]